jgi:hypothetical protein
MTEPMIPESYPNKNDPMALMLSAELENQAAITYAKIAAM